MPIKVLLHSSQVSHLTNFTFQYHNLQNIYVIVADCPFKSILMFYDIAVLLIASSSCLHLIILHRYNKLEDF